MSDIRIRFRCARCSDMFLVRACANYTDLCDTCQRILGVHATERSIFERNEVYRYTRDRFHINADGNPLNAFSPRDGKSSVAFLPGIRADEPTPSVERMRDAIRSVRSTSPPSPQSGGK